MQNKKVTMLAAVLAVTVIAMAGVGYAITYTATTTNTGNGMDSTYLELTQEGKGKYTENFLTKLYFDSVNEWPTDENATAAVTTYDPVNTHRVNSTSDSTSYTVTDDKTVANTALISEALGIKIKAENTKETAVDMDVTVDNFTPTSTGLKYTMVLTKTVAADGSFTVYRTADYTDTTDDNEVNGSWHFQGIEITSGTTVSYIVMLFVTETSEGAADGTTGFTSTDKDNGGMKNKFTFVITADTDADTTATTDP